MLGQANGRMNYFRAFVGNIPTTNTKLTSRLDVLLPHRTKRTARLYGVTPLVFTANTNLIPKAKNKPKNKRRIEGPEIAPNMAEVDEFINEEFY